jgi:hypothetical protein
MKLPKLGMLDRVKQFIPTMTAWKWLLLLWFVANVLDCISTFLALHYGAQEANPAAREAGNMYVSKWFGVIVLTVMAGLFQWKSALKLLTVTMWLVALSNFAVLGMVAVQPSLGEQTIDVSTPAFLIQLGETLIIAALLLWHKEIWETLQKVPLMLKRRGQSQIG